MDEYKIVSQINCFQNQIYDLQISIDEKNRKIQDLESFRCKFNSMSSDFDNKISFRRQAILNVQINASQCKILKRYQSKMESVLTGNKKENRKESVNIKTIRHDVCSSIIHFCMEIQNAHDGDAS